MPIPWMEERGGMEGSRMNGGRIVRKAKTQCDEIKRCTQDYKVLVRCQLSIELDAFDCRQCILEFCISLCKLE